jgi:hypothetical protein
MRNRDRKQLARLKYIEPLPTSPSLDEAFRQIELQRQGGAEDWRVVLRQKGFVKQPDGSYSKV